MKTRSEKIMIAKKEKKEKTRLERLPVLKVAFFQKELFVFQISKIKIFQKTILSLKFKVQDSFLE
jgi:hypothetical protein